MQLREGPGGKGRRFKSIMGLGLMGFGVLLVFGVGAFFIYSWRANSSLDELNVTAPVDESRPSAILTPRREETELPTASVTEESVGFSPEIIAAQRMFPGEAVPPLYWLNPMEAEASYALVNPLLGGFVPVAQAAPRHSLAVPVSITIPAIDLDSEVISLQILDLGNSLAYETPKDVVGHIPETANAGEDGTAWFFGHLGEPDSGRGERVCRSAQAPGLLRSGPVYAEVKTESQLFSIS